MTDSVSVLKPLLDSVPCTRVAPREFFFAWSGVPTLAYRGFSGTLLSLKNELTTAIPRLKAENAGSLWPKTTLGALRDDRTLSWEDAQQIRGVCDRFNGRMQTGYPDLSITELSLVVFACRSLERRLATVRFGLRGEGVDPSSDAPPLSHLAEVEATMAPFGHDQLPKYLAGLQKAGNREAHYRMDHIEATLVADLGDWNPPYLEEFIAAIDVALPGAYTWFAPSSRHMTVRALVTS